MVLLVGATGRLGSRIARELLSARTPVRALCRQGSGYAALRRMGAEIVFGDLRDRASLDAACAGIDTVLSTANAVRRGGDDTIESVDLQGTRALIDAAVASGVGRVVLMSALGADAASPLPLLAAKGRSEQYLRESGLAWTVIAPNLFMESWPGEIVGRPALEGRQVVIVGDGRMRHTFIAEHDVAAFSVASLRHPAAVNRRLDIGGPQALSWRDVIATYERVLGRTVEARFEPVGNESDAVAAPVRPLLEAMDQYETVFDSGELAKTLGVEQTPLEQWVRASVAMTRRSV